MNAVLAINRGAPVRIKGTSPQINGANYEIIPVSYNIKGELLTFTFNGHLYINIDLIQYDVRDRGKGGLIFGYCKQSAYNTYRNSISEYRLKDFLKLENWFTDFQSAQIGDIFKIEKVEFSRSFTNNYTKYFIHTKYEFRITNLNIKFSNTEEYPVENPDQSSPNYCKKILVDQDQINSYSTKDEGNFFTKNFKNKIANINISEESKQVLYEGITKICFRIDRIFQDVLDTLAIRKLQDILNFIKNGIPVGTSVSEAIKSNNTLLSSTTDKTIAQLLVDWGYRSYADTKELTLDFSEDKFYGGLYKPFDTYYNALVNLYNNLYQKNETQLFGAPNTDPGTWTPAVWTEQNNIRFQYLNFILPKEVLILLSAAERVKIIELYISKNELPTEAEDIVLRIIYSFSLVSTDGQFFLDFLLQTVDGYTKTNFERLFDLFDDKDIQQVSPVVGFFANERTNRRNFVYGVYRLWQKSNYNFNFIDGVVPDQWGLNPNSYFYTTNGKKYFEGNANKIKNIALEFGTIWQGDAIGNDDTKTIASIEKKYTKPKIQSTDVVCSWQFINVEKTLNSNNEVKDTQAHVDFANIFPTELKFHLFQPITLVGYKTDEELEPTFPKRQYVPAFLWYYSEEFNRLKDFHAELSFAIDVGIEVGLFFLTGGVTALAELRYLRYATEIAKAIKAGTGSAHYTVLVLKGLSGAAQTVTLTSAICERYYDLLVKLKDPNNHYTEDEKRNYEYLHKIFLNLTLISAGVTGALEYGVGKYARKVLAADNTFLNGLDSEIRNMVGQIAGYDTAALNAFKQQKLTGLSKISAKFETGSLWSIIKQKKFYEDFKSLSNADLLRLNDDVALANWEKLLTNNIADRLILDITTNTSEVNRIVKYYEQYRIRIRLSDWSTSERWKFLRKVKDDDTVFNTYRQDWELLDDWNILYKEANTTTSFMNLEANIQLNLLIKHRNNLQAFKKNPELIDHWKLFHTELNTQAKFDSLSASEQIIFLTEHGGNFVRFKKDPNFINSWLEINNHILRKQIDYLEAYSYVSDIHVIDKLAQIKSINGKWVGGHLGSELFDSSNDIYAILDPGTIPLSTPRGSRIYKQVRTTSITMTDGITSKRKDGWHTWIEGISRQEFKEDVAFAYLNKINYLEEISPKGETYLRYVSKFQDGTPVKLVIIEPHWIDEYDDIFSHHLSAILIEP
ncbi:hypothetical protein BBH99_04015 [Chryseobacterium contaminans]|uniref:Uncharacterized protein n=1 Tax=Chryseobacterium contaminans TaxID=1423959 RepID=A0A1M7A134_9FLAO|nr:hypothetical protein [Chryseobacterium contaminans]OCA80499.1 hypothetical protein BBH99_04015 [Chryseobacterium contaminans]SHL36424.1 hypothetical protein SAMN05444407_103445 [Chryseobacterium contaminans]